MKNNAPVSLQGGYHSYAAVIISHESWVLNKIFQKALSPVK